MKAAIQALSKRVAAVEARLGLYNQRCRCCPTLSPSPPPAPPATTPRSFQSVKAEIDKKTGHNLGEEFEAIKKELADIHAAAHRDTDARGKKLADLHIDIENVHKSAAGGDISGHLDSLSRSNEKMLDQLASQHKRMFGVSIFAIAFIIVAGLSLYNKSLGGY